MMSGCFPLQQRSVMSVKETQLLKVNSRRTMTIAGTKPKCDQGLPTHSQIWTFRVSLRNDILEIQLFDHESHHHEQTQGILIVCHPDTMRLLRTETCELHNFAIDVPPYAILSHTWGDEEVTFDAIGYKATRSRYRGWNKIANCCRRALTDGWQWLWVDTCCINKADSTELGEAINSMYRWYEAAETCYAYLGDVPPKYRLSDGVGCEPRDGSISPKDGNGIPWVWNFRSSRWFTRGWTLQELLAPRFLLFMDCDWGSIGSREIMAQPIQEATGIDVKYLYDTATSSVATKISWAANRQTTREEDRAYSLLGLLGVNMPLIYGEGERAFLRLQKELIQIQNDESVLAWGLRPMLDSELFGAAPKLSYSNAALGRSPDDFERNGIVVPCAFDRQRRTFASTNVGISLNTEVFECRTTLNWGEGERTLHAVKLNCRQEWPRREDARSPIVLLLVARDLELNLFQRYDIRVWNERDFFGWKSLGRMDVLISYDNTLESSRLRKQSHLWFKYPVSGEIQLQMAWLFDSHEWVAAGDKIEVTDILDVSPTRGKLPNLGSFEPDGGSSDGIYFTQKLLPDRAICHRISVSQPNAPRLLFWLVIKQSLRLPHVGIWADIPIVTVTDFVKTVASLPAHSYPKTAALGDQQAVVELALKPLGHDTSRVTAKEYLLAIDIVPVESYTGEIGRFVIKGSK